MSEQTAPPVFSRRQIIHPSAINGVNFMRITSSLSRSASSRIALRGGRSSFFAVGQWLRSSAVLACFLAAGLGSVHALAADADAVSVSAKTPIVVSLKQFKVLKDPKGGTQFVDAALVLPGDVIEYRATYSNRSATAIPVVATLPIPESTEYIKDSAKAAGELAHTVALKDSQFASEPLIQKLTTSGGATLSQPIPYASYRYVRWDLGRLASGKSIEVSVRAKVAQNSEVDASAGDKAIAIGSSPIKN